MNYSCFLHSVLVAKLVCIVLTRRKGDGFYGLCVMCYGWVVFDEMLYLVLVLVSCPLRYSRPSRPESKSGRWLWVETAGAERTYVIGLISCHYIISSVVSFYNIAMTLSM